MSSSRIANEPHLREIEELRARVAELEHATRELSERERLFRAIVEHAPDIITRFDRELRYSYVNPAIQRAGRSPDEIIGRTQFDVNMPDETARELQAVVRDVYETGQERVVERRLSTPVGVRHYQIRYVPQLGDDGTVEHVLTFARDITMRVQAEEQLQRAEARYRTLVEQIPAVIYVGAIDETNTPLYVSPQSEAIFGYRPQEWLADPRFWLDHIHPDDLPAVLAESARSDTEGTPFSAEYRFIARDGREVWVRNDAMLVRDDQGAPLFWQGLLLDISERRHMEQTLRESLERAEQAAAAEQQSRAEAEAAARLREEFLSIASHELRTPLTSIKAAVQLVARRLAAPDFEAARVMRFTEQLGEEVVRLEELVADLLDASRIQQGRLDLRTEPMDLAALARRVLERFEQAPERGEHHVLELDAPEPVVGIWDPARLDQVITNLVSNALKYAPGGGVVRLRVRRGEHEAELSVSDQGIGIAPEELAQLFQPFARGALARDSTGGTGLGLYISAQIVERHGGTIAVESEPGRGSTFTVRLPPAPRQGGGLGVSPSSTARPGPSEHLA